MRVLYAHGLESGPTGYKVRQLEEQDLEVTAPDCAMSLFNLLQSNSVVRSLFSPRTLFHKAPTKWLSSAMDMSFEACFEIMTAAVDVNCDVLVGSSWGGAVAAAVVASDAWQGPAVILCPPLAIKERWAGASSHPSFGVFQITNKLAALPAHRKK